MTISNALSVNNKVESEAQNVNGQLLQFRCKINYTVFDSIIVCLRLQEETSTNLVGSQFVGIELSQPDVDQSMSLLTYT